MYFDRRVKDRFRQSILGRESDAGRFVVWLERRVVLVGGRFGKRAVDVFAARSAPAFAASAAHDLKLHRLRT